MKPLNEIEQKYWQDYLKLAIPNDLPPKPFVEAAYAGNPEITDDLLGLYLAGTKVAGSSIAEDFLSAGDPLPQVGNYWIYLNSKGSPSLILRTERVVFNKFKDVPIEIAIAEGEGDLSLDYWRRIHSEIYTPSLSTWGVRDLAETTVVTEFFKIVYK